LTALTLIKPKSRDLV